MAMDRDTTKALFFVVCLLVLILLAAGLYSLAGLRGERIPKEPVIRQFPVMGTVCEIKLWSARPELASKAADAATDAIREVESTCSVFSKNSEVFKLNATAAKAPFVCSPMVWDILTNARRYNEISQGSFDITVKPLMVLWGFYKKRGELPSQQEIDDAKKFVGMDKLEFDDFKHTIHFKVDGMGIDFGGIAKGYALDKAADAVLALGVNRGLINLGGNMRCLPLPPPGKKSYTIGVRNPMRKDDVLGKVKLLNCCIGTSGDYERYVVIGGRHFTHIMDPKTGLPVENMLSVTVIAPVGVDSDGLSKYPFVEGLEAAKELTKKIPGCAVLVVKRNPNDPKKMVVDKFGGEIWHDVKAP